MGLMCIYTSAPHIISIITLFGLRRSSYTTIRYQFDVNQQTLAS